MACCGSTRKRAELVVDVPLGNQPLPAQVVEPPHAPIAVVYTGTTRLFVEGPVTRRRYRFEHPGAVVEVDARDVPAFAAIPNLRASAQVADER